jgi:hypothetical protein
VGIKTFALFSSLQSVWHVVSFCIMEANYSSSSVQPLLEYEYTPLHLEEGAFRLLCLRPSDDPSSDIHCELIPGKVGWQVDDGGELLDYHPLSYVWGDPDPPKTIYVEGKSMVIRPNLFAALKQLRLREKRLLLWVDAICIDQNNLDERNQQINLMEQIYRLNASVYMWLGEEADESDLAMETLSLIGAFLDEDRAEQAKKIEQFMKSSFDRSYDRNWKAVTGLFSRNYWTRVWILQEVLQSSQAILHCGSKSLPWPPIHAFLVNWPKFSLGIAAHKAMYYSSWPRELAKFHLQVITEKISLLDGLLLSRPRFATMRVDYVYGILSLVDLKGCPLPPNYSKGTMTVFRDVVLHAIQTERNLDILTACKGHDLGSSKRPSSHRKHVQFAHSKVLHMLRQLKIVPHMAAAILDSPENPVQLEDLSTTDQSGFKGHSGSNPNDDSSVIGPDSSGGSLNEGLQETKADALRELQEHLQVPYLRVAMQSMLRNAKLPDLLRTIEWANSVDELERQILPWPSWIPDWTIPHPKSFQPGIPYLLLSEPKPSFYKAAGTTEPLYTFPEDESLFIVRGGLVDRVEHVSPHYRSHENPASSEIFKIAEMDWQWYCTLVGSANPYGDEEARIRAFRGTQVLGRDVSGNEEDFSDETFHDMFWKQIGVTALKADRITHGLLRDPRFNYGNGESAGGFSGGTRIERASWYMRYDSRFFVTQQGNVGRGPPSLQPGDQVCVLFGGRVPFILRKDDEAEEYQLVGEACEYLHLLPYTLFCKRPISGICLSCRPCRWHHC